MRRLHLAAASALALGAGLVACNRQVVVGSPEPGSVTTMSTAPNTLTPQEQAAGWHLLFDGKTIDQWRGYKATDVPAAWHVDNGLLTKTGEGEDIVTKQTYANFELQMDWKITTGGNAGLFYRGTEEYDHIYWSAPEYQLLDDANHPDGRNPLTSAGADYALYPAPRGYVNPANEWNHTRIVVDGNHVQHYLNGHLMVDYTLMSPDWEAKVKASKFADWPHYGRAPRGLIGLQGDHPGTLEIRNMKIRELP